MFYTIIKMSVYKKRLIDRHIWHPLGGSNP